MDTITVEPKTAGKSANLLPGGMIGNKGGGRPKSRIRERAGRVYDDVLAEFEGYLARHQTACKARNDKQPFEKSDILTASELGKIASEVKTIGMGELKDVSLDKEQYLEALQATLSEMSDRLSYV